MHALPHKIVYYAMQSLNEIEHLFEKWHHTQQIINCLIHERTPLFTARQMLDNRKSLLSNKISFTGSENNYRYVPKKRNAFFFFFLKRIADLICLSPTSTHWVFWYSTSNLNVGGGHICLNLMPAAISVILI